MPRLTPYDSGEVLEPKPWVNPRTHEAGTEVKRPAEPDDWGKVDFENDESATELVIRAVRRDGAIVLEVELVNDMEDVVITVDGEPIWRSDEDCSESSESSVPAGADSTIGGNPA